MSDDIKGGVYDSPTYGDLQSPSAESIRQEVTAQQDGKVNRELAQRIADSARVPQAGRDFNQGPKRRESFEEIRDRLNGIPAKVIRKEFASGMVRDVEEGKTDFTRVLDGPMLERWAKHLTNAEARYPDIAPGVANWTLAAGKEELVRFRKSAFRHFWQWLMGREDEDHAAATLFNINGYEFVREKLEKQRTEEGIRSSVLPSESRENYRSVDGASQAASNKNQREAA